MKIGSSARPLGVAIIGSGPSGFYAAEALLKQADFEVRIDMFDRLPTPYGLVRGGVAPDHQKIKNVVAVYEKAALNPRFRFFGNVKLGRDIQVEDLTRHYDQIVYAVGNESDRKLGVTGEDLSGNHSATAFVGWYNGHPDFREETFDLTQESVAVIGIGNVAIDVTRILARDPEELKETDIAGYALDALRQSKVETIWLLGRRGPAQAAYSPAEIKEIGDLVSADLVIDPAEVVLGPESEKDYTDPQNKKNVDYVVEHARRGEGTLARKVRLRFCVSPVEVLGQDGRVVALKLERNKLTADASGNVKASGTGEYETIPVGLVFRSVGYRGIPIPGVPFDDRAGKIPNAEGRVLNQAGGDVLAAQYVVGWAKRGPSGLIGTNRADSVATVKAMLEDAAAGKFGGETVEPDDKAIPALLEGRGARYVSFADWKVIDEVERTTGAARGKIREKLTTVEEMLEAVQSRKAPLSV
ncbi:MAG: FAD/NAD(P)-binding protein [Candidatus Sericytochromatia bacterium]|uniref:ferredoxin--NADP(+) reductase n=1 Tax=Candidatus Tanganyikabacteria bacterium TaxID=2961651 RepID=A0A937X8C4_9BACT|nr:FAD/NAD(P)-binding protein [Candidatus Tanganyikabacteria bacterium]